MQYYNQIVDVNLKQKTKQKQKPVHQHIEQNIDKTSNKISTISVFRARDRYRRTGTGTLTHSLTPIIDCFISLFPCRWPQISDLIPLLLEVFFFSKSYLSFADILYILLFYPYPTTLLDPLIYYILYYSIINKYPHDRQGNTRDSHNCADMGVGNSSIYAKNYQHSSCRVRLSGMVPTDAW